MGSHENTSAFGVPQSRGTDIVGMIVVQKTVSLKIMEEVEGGMSSAWGVGNKTGFGKKVWVSFRFCFEQVLQYHLLLAAQCSFSLLSSGTPVWPQKWPCLTSWPP